MLTGLEKVRRYDKVYNLTYRLGGWLFNVSLCFSGRLFSRNFQSFLRIFKKECMLKPFKPNVLFLHRLKNSENLRFSDVFRGIEIEHWAKMG